MGRLRVKFKYKARNRMITTSQIGNKAISLPFDSAAVLFRDGEKLGKNPEYQNIASKMSMGLSD